MGLANKETKIPIKLYVCTSIGKTIIGPYFKTTAGSNRRTDRLQLHLDEIRLSGAQLDIARPCSEAHRLHKTQSLYIAIRQQALVRAWLYTYR